MVRQHLLCGYHMCLDAKLPPWCQTVCDPMDCSRQALLSVGFSRQKCWSGLPCPPPGDHPDPGTEPTSPALAGKFLTTSATWEAFTSLCIYYILICCDPLYRKLQKGRDFCLILASVSSRYLEPCWKHSNASIHYIIILCLKPQSV